jgi:hypothetical protein
MKDEKATFLFYAVVDDLLLQLKVRQVALSESA